MSFPYAIAQGDRAIRHSMCAPPTPISGTNQKVSEEVCHRHSMLKPSSVMFGSEVIYRFVDRWIPKDQEAKPSATKTKLTQSAEVVVATIVAERQPDESERVQFLHVGRHL